MTSKCVKLRTVFRLRDIRIAVTRRFKNSNGERYDADFINCVRNGRQTGEFTAKHFQKGGMIAVVGSIQSGSWDGNDGKKAVCNRSCG